MRLLVSGATADVRRTDPARVGVLVVPGAGNAPNGVAGRVWGIDNAAFSGFDAQAFEATLRRYAGVDGCRFVVAPDVVADAARTLALFHEWRPIIRALGFPVALAAQDGLVESMVPWGCVDALFIGGSTEWKLGRQAEALLMAADVRGKWRHVGRVNTLSRMRHFSGLTDSIDGSGFSRWPKRIGLFSRWLDEIDRAPRFDEVKQ